MRTCHLNSQDILALTELEGWQSQGDTILHKCCILSLQKSVTSILSWSNHRDYCLLQKQHPTSRQKFSCLLASPEFRPLWVQGHRLGGGPTLRSRTCLRHCRWSGLCKWERYYSGTILLHLESRQGSGLVLFLQEHQKEDLSPGWT